MLSGKLSGNQVVAFQLDRNLPLALRVEISSFNAFHCAALRASVVDVLVKLFITLGNALPLSLISFPVLPSNNTTCPSVEEDGHNTSQAHSPSSPSDTVKLSLFPLVSVIVTVVTFQLLELVIDAIQFPVAQVFQVSHLSHFSPSGITKSNTAALDVPELVTDALVQG